MGAREGEIEKVVLQGGDDPPLTDNFSFLIFSREWNGVIRSVAQVKINFILRSIGLFFFSDVCASIQNAYPETPCWFGIVVLLGLWCLGFDAKVLVEGLEPLLLLLRFSTQMHIKCFNTKVRYMASKAKPKKVSLRTLETGEQVFFLCKQVILAVRGHAWRYCGPVRCC